MSGKQAVHPLCTHTHADPLRTHYTHAHTTMGAYPVEHRCLSPGPILSTNTCTQSTATATLSLTRLSTQAMIAHHPVGGGDHLLYTHLIPDTTTTPTSAVALSLTRLSTQAMIAPTQWGAGSRNWPSFAWSSLTTVCVQRAKGGLKRIHARSPQSAYLKRGFRRNSQQLNSTPAYKGDLKKELKNSQQLSAGVQREEAAHPHQSTTSAWCICVP